TRLQGDWSSDVCSSDLAQELGLPLAQPAKIRDAVADIHGLKPDIGIVVAYGKILPPELLRVPFFNVHASLLPKYRGAAPIQRARSEERRVGKGCRCRGS